MTAWDDILKPATVFCDACNDPILSTPVHRETCRTPLGRCTLKTHDDPACIQAARDAVDGTPVRVRETGQDKVNTHLRGKR